MFATLLTFSTTTTPTTLRITSIVSVVLAVPELWVPPSPSSPLRVRLEPILVRFRKSNTNVTSLDSKQARDLVNVLAEAKQNIDPRLAEMVRYGGGGGGGGRWGGGRGRGGGGRGRGGGHHGGGGFSSNNAPLGRDSRW
jgi:uncharacterized membrane protein YgcG